MTTFLAAAIPFLFFGILALSAWYVDARLRTLFGAARPRWPARVVTALASVGLLGIVGITATSASAAAGVVYVVGGYLFTFYLYLLLALLLLHAGQRLWPLAGRRAGAATALAAAFLATGLGAIWAQGLQVEETEIRVTGLQREVTVMQISDVHLGHHRQGAYLARIVEETNRRRPDMVLITGDLVDANAALLPGVLDPLADFEAPVYFVGGNHENDIDTARAFDLIARHGVRILRNELVQTHGLQLIGLDYMKADEDTFDMHPSEDSRTIKDVVRDLPLDAGQPSLLMQHSPVGVTYIEQAGVDVIVAGHTHGGQLFPATLIAAQIFPFNRGLYRQNHTQVFVSQGAGTFMLPIRLGSSNQVDLLRLLPASR